MMDNIIQKANHLGKIGEPNLKSPLPEHTTSPALHGNVTHLEDSKISMDNHASASIRKGRKAITQPYRETRVLKPSPYFYYIDHTKDIDSNPLAPLTPLMSVPNFIIKMHAILVCDSLNCVQWMPHGRSWKILNQSEFEKLVLPIYFTQGSIGSFYRQANGWGFRRMLKGPDKGSFYNEHFLRGLPFLAKTMNRIGHAKVFEGANINHEPDLWRINAEHPTPEEWPKNSLDYIVLSTINKCVQEFGPKAKMPPLQGIIESAASQPDESSARKKEGTGEVTSTVPQTGVHNASPSTMARSSNIATTSGALTSSTGQLAGQNSALSYSQTQSLLQQHQLQILSERTLQQQILNEGTLSSAQATLGAQNLNPLQLIQAQQLQLLYPVANNDSLLQILSASNHAAAPFTQQQQLMATVPAAYAANMLSSAGQYSSAPTIAHNFANSTSQMGLQTGYGRSFPEASFGRSSNAIGQIYPHEAQQGTITNNTGLPFESVNCILTSLLNNLSQSQSQPVTNSLTQLPHHPTIMPSQQTRQDYQTNQSHSTAIIAMLLANLGTQHGQS